MRSRHPITAFGRIGSMVLGCGAVCGLVFGLSYGLGGDGVVYAAAATTQSAKAKDPSEIDPPRRPSAVEILQELMKKKQSRPVIMPTDPATPSEAAHYRPPTASRPSVSPSKAERPLHPDGSMITDRIGRLVRRDDGWFFVFESEGKVLREPPMEILPNQDLQTMEITSANGTKPVKFKVTGEVTTYRGENYLLLRKVLVVHDMGNLK